MSDFRLKTDREILNEILSIVRRPVHGKDCSPLDLQVIYTQPMGDAEAVVRWCKRCGAVSVDRDYDGRTNPGDYMQMRFPTNK